MITLKNVQFSYELNGADKILNNINIEFEKNKISIIIGANGSGKSTLINICSRLLRPNSGEVLLDNVNIFDMDTKKVAQRVSMLPQEQGIPYDLSVFNLVKMGRYPYQSLFSTYTKEDEKFIYNSLEITDMLDLKDKSINMLSGGQRQRARIAMLLAQDTSVMMLDEPTNHLDLRYKIEILDLLKRLNKQENRTIILVLHDINLASRYAHKIVALKNGSVICAGKPGEVIKKNIIDNAFDVKSYIMKCPIFGTPSCIVH